MKIRLLFVVSLLLVVFIKESARTRAVPPSVLSTANHADISTDNATIPLNPISFEANRGQYDSEAKFLLRASGYNLFLTRQEMVLVLGGSGRRHWPSFWSLRWTRHLRRDPRRPSVVRMSFADANSEPEINGLNELPGKSNYFIGNDPQKWHIGIPHYKQVEYRELYPGVNLIFYGKERQLEYDFVVAPGADPRRIKFNLDGVQEIEADLAGSLTLHTTAGSVQFHRPLIYQEVNGTRREISGGYQTRGRNGIGFYIGAYDPGRHLVIDPILSYSTYLGGMAGDNGRAIALDDAGNIYVTGSTDSQNFPTRNPVRERHSSTEAFVTKLDATASRVIYSTYIGGNGNENLAGGAVAVDSSGNIYLSGDTDSEDFPTVNSFQGTSGGGAETFVVKLNPAGSAILYSSFLGGRGDDIPFGMVVDASGKAYVAGGTDSPNFPIRTPLQSTFRGGDLLGIDSFIARIDPAGPTLAFSTYLGGAGDDLAVALVVDASGSVYVCGATSSGDFPVRGAIQPDFKGGDMLGTDSFVAKLNPSGSGLEYSTFLGGSQDDLAVGIAIDKQGSAYVTGATVSANFPVKNALQSTLRGGAVYNSDAFVAKLDPAGSTLVYSTYLGGSATAGGRGDEIGIGIAVDSSGNAYVTGGTSAADFPVVDPVQRSLASRPARADIFVAKLNPAGSALTYSTYLGGKDEEFGFGIAVDSSGAVYVAGNTFSKDFPTVNPVQASNGGGSDAFVIKIAEMQTGSNRPRRRP